MNKNLSDCQLPPAAVDVKGDYIGGYSLVGSAKTVHDYEGSAGNRGALLVQSNLETRSALMNGSFCDLRSRSRAMIRERV